VQAAQDKLNAACNECRNPDFCKGCSHVLALKAAKKAV
jgi:hypothetical protein